MVGTITDKLSLLANTKANIKQAIINKGVAVSSSDAFSTYPDKIAAISSGGGGSDEDHGGAYHIIVVDYDGTILKEDHLNTGEVFTMPNAPTHDRLAFAEWSSSQALVNNTIVVADNDVIAGPIYDTKSGLNEFDVEVNTAAGMTAYLPMDGTKDWGDGTTDTTTSHTYTTAGNYTITCDGTKITGVICGPGNYPPDNFIYTHIRLTNITQYANYTFWQLRNLQTINLAKNSPTVTTRILGSCTKLKCCIFPSGFAGVASEMFSEDYALEYAVPTYNVGYLGSKAFYNCYALKACILPKGITLANYGNDALYNTYNLRELTWVFNDVTSYPKYNTCYNLERLICTSNVATIASDILGAKYNLDVIDFSHATAVPTLSNYGLFQAGTYFNRQLKIKVPAALYNEWIEASIWKTYYANNIVAVDANGNEV